MVIQIALQVERANLGDKEFQIVSEFGLEIWINSACSQFFNSFMLMGVELDQGVNWIPFTLVFM